MATPFDVPVKFRADESGLMPEKYYTIKQDMTEIYEDPLLLSDYQQDLLKDFRPDPATMASDAPRRHVDKSRGFLNILHGGSRSGLEVGHPEIFLGDMTPDPRGFKDEPEFKLMRDQAERRKYIIQAQMGNDADPSITSGGVGNAYFNHWRSHSIPYLRERMKIFGYEYGNMLKGNSRMNYKNLSRVSDVMAERGKFMSKEDILNVPEKATIVLSNITNPGMRSTPDHLITVGGENKVYSIRAGKVVPVNRDLLDTDMEFQPSILFKNRKNLAKTIEQALSDRDKIHTLNGDMNYGDAITTRVAKTAEQYQYNKDWINSVSQDQKFGNKASDSITPAIKTLNAENLNPQNIRRETFINPKAVEIMSKILSNPKKIKQNVRKNARSANFNLEEGHQYNGMGIGGQPLFVSKSKATENMNNIRRKVQKGDIVHHMADMKVANYKQKKQGKLNRKNITGDVANNINELANNKSSKRNKTNNQIFENRRDGKTQEDNSFEESGELNRFGGKATRHTNHYTKSINAEVPQSLEF